MQFHRNRLLIAIFCLFNLLILIFLQILYLLGPFVHYLCLCTCCILSSYIIMYSGSLILIYLSKVIVSIRRLVMILNIYGIRIRISLSIILLCSIYRLCSALMYFYLLLIILIVVF